MTKLIAIILPLTIIVLLNIVGQCEMSIYPGLRRKPTQQQLQSFDVSSDFLSQLMEENARRRLQQQFVQQLELIKMQRERQRQREREQRLREKLRQQQLQELAENEEDYVSGNTNANNNNGYDQYDTDTNVDYAMRYPNGNVDENVLRERPFAVGPNDPRFFQDETLDDDDVNPEGDTADTELAGEDDEPLDPNTLAEYEEYVPAETKQVASGVVLKSDVGTQDNNGLKDNKGVSTSADASDAVLAPALPVEASKLLDTQGTTTFHRIKPQTAAAAAVAGVNVASIKSTTLNAAAGAQRHDINALMDKLHKEGKASAILNSEMGGHDESHMVVRQHLGIDSEMGMYVVALIAGVSAAVTVGLIAIGIAWVHNRAKAAADVEYPAYGVTGPNRDISPSNGDRKLAQSAQMYHYQHQKQQIIAMENRQGATEGNCGMSDVESDDDNEEGDYTVYECPGLAPTGEMEVKNPLFLDETPVTPAGAVAATNNITQATHQQPPAANTRKNAGKSVAAAATVVTAANNMAAAVSLSSDEKTKKKAKK